MAIPLSEIKKWNPERYERICRRLARGKKEVKEGNTTRERRQEYEIGPRDARYIEELRRTKSSSNTQPNRSRRSGWQHWLGLSMTISLLIGILMMVLLILGPLTSLDQALSRTLGGSLLLSAALSFWLRPVIEQVVRYSGMWRALWSAVWRNPLDNPGMLASLGAAIMYVIDWWPSFGSTLIPTIAGLIKIGIYYVMNLFG